MAPAALTSNGGPPRIEKPAAVQAIRSKLDPSFKQFAELISHIRKPVPDETGDGSDIQPEDPWRLVTELKNGINDLSHIGAKDVKTLLEVSHKSKTGQLIDDRTYLMEGLIQAAAKLPDGSELGQKLTNSFLTQLWNDLQHPPQAFMGNQFGYRSADGSHNSRVHPMLGAAGAPYARSVKPATMQPGARPDPGVIFDTLFARKHTEEHPNGISSMLFYLASIIIHDLFRTDHNDFSTSTTSSYLDLAPLYGSNQDEQDLMRTREDGKIKADCFSEKRLLSFPPGVGALLIMFNRFHNYVVEQLAAINEGGRFTKPKTEDQAKLAKYDEDLFQTGRLITCGLYVNIILIDYVRTILNLNKTDSNWQLNPRVPIKDGPPLGVGNQVSAEFNLVYRWHAAISKRDEEWTEGSWQQMFPGRDPKSVGKYEFLMKLRELDEKIPADPPQREFAGLQRGADGRYPDDGLVQILADGIDDCANSFGAQRVPAVMRAVEILGIEQARSWNLATLNEFRKYFGLTPHRTFEDINSDPEVADTLRHLYDHPDLVEMYPGLVAEEAKKPMVPGAGLTPSYTVSRAVLSDATALVRGDRFYTIDYHPKKLTNWGYSEVNYDLEIDNGCVFYKLFLRAFPRHFAVDSVYAHYPLTVPRYMKIALQDLNKDQLYSFDRPRATGEPQMVRSYATADAILGNKEVFKVTWGAAMEFLMGSPARDFMLSGDGFANARSRQMMEKALYVREWNEEVRRFYEDVTARLLREKSYRLGDVRQVDIIRDVGNLAHVHFCAELFCLPLKTHEHPAGIFTEHELYLIMSAVFICVFFDLDPASSFPLRQKAYKATHTLGELVQANVEEIKASGIFSDLANTVFPHNTPLKSYGKHLIERLLASGMDVKELVWGHIMGTAGGMVSNQGQLFGQTIEYFLTAGKEHLPEIQRLARLEDEQSFDTLTHYFLEGSRLYGETGVFRRVAKDVDVVDGDRTLHLTQGDRVMVNLRAASHDPTVFPNPDVLDLHRPVASYIHLGAGPHQCLGLPMTRVALTTMLKMVARLDGLRPAPGPQGVVHKIARPTVAGEPWPYHAYLTENHDGFWPFPTSLKVNWDGGI